MNSGESGCCKMDLIGVRMVWLCGGSGLRAPSVEGSGRAGT